MEEVTFNKKQLADSIHNLQSSLDSVSATITKGQDPLERELTPPRETTLEKLHKRIDALCAKPGINFAELDEMFLSPDEREKIKQINIEDVEKKVTESVMTKTVDKVSVPQGMELPQLPEVPEPQRPQQLPTQQLSPEVPPTVHGHAPQPHFEHPEQHPDSAKNGFRMPEIVDAIDDLQPPAPVHEKKGEYDDLLADIKANLPSQ